MKEFLKWIKTNWIILLVNIFVLLPMIGVLAPFDVDLSGDQPLVNYTIQAELEEDLVAAGKTVSPLWLPVHITGEWAIRLLVITLTCTPLTILFGWKTRRYRKLFGIYAFLYSTAHVLFFLADRGVLAIFSEFNFVLGLIATIIIIPLGITSNKWSMRLLKANWKKMQKLAYPAGIFALLHVLFLQGGAWQFYALIMGLGLGVRIPFVKKLIQNLRQEKLNLGTHPI